MNQIEIPRNWKHYSIGEIGEVVTGSTPSKSKSEYYGSDYPFFKPADLDAGPYIRFARDGLSQEGIKNARILPVNSILVTCIGASIGKTAILDVVGATNQQINSVIPNTKLVLPKYVYYWFISNTCQRSIIEYSSSATLPILNKSKFMKINILIPSKELQKKIVQKLDHVFVQLEERKKPILELQNKKLKSVYRVSDDLFGELITKYYNSTEVLNDADIMKLSDACIINPTKNEIKGVSEDLEVSFVPMKAVDDEDGLIKTPEIRMFGEVKDGYTYFKENGCETSERTFRRYKTSWKNKSRDRIIQARKDTYYTEPLQQFETMKKVEKELWGIVQSEKNNSVLLRVLNSIANVQEKMNDSHKEVLKGAHHGDWEIRESKKPKFKSVDEEVAWMSKHSLTA